ncbi:MAG: sulfite exporter TauE/SafE family protein [Candidatus Micrarchaeota archaeon]|nr:sulfite exporter TauE/SafE family protein [Candidatus Micrarchaeota archaeon]
MIDYLQLFILFIVGVIGYSYNSIAGGYSFLSVPALLLVGLNPLNTIATNLSSQMFPDIMTILNYWRHKKLEIKPVLNLVVFFMVGALVGAQIVLSLEAFILKALITALLTLGVIMLLLKNRINLAFLRENKPLEAFFLFAVGVYKSIFGASAKTLTMMVLTMGRGMKMVESSAAASVLMGVAVWTGSAYYIISGAVSWPHFVALTLGGILGAFLGTQLAVKKGDAFVEKVLILVALVGAAKVLFF